MNISIIIPLLNEKESLLELINSIDEVMKAYSFTNEIILIDDGSTDGSWELIQNLSIDKKNIKGIKFLRNYGKSQALHAGFLKSKGDVVFTMDADLQDDQQEIPEMYNMIKKTKPRSTFTVLCENKDDPNIYLNLDKLDKKFIIEMYKNGINFAKSSLKD